MYAIRGRLVCAFRASELPLLCARRVFVSSVRSGRAFELRASASLRSSELLSHRYGSSFDELPSSATYLPYRDYGSVSSDRSAFRDFRAAAAPRGALFSGQRSERCCDAVSCLLAVSCSGPACPAVAVVATFPQSDLELVAFSCVADQWCCCSATSCLRSATWQRSSLPCGAVVATFPQSDLEVVAPA